MNNHTVIFILGPTSSGKTVIAVELAAILNGEIISCDSMQGYMGMDVITRVPSPEIIKKVSHHLVGFMSPEEEYNAARFRIDAGKSIEDIVKRGEMPIVVGGTGLYVKALADGISLSLIHI